MKQIFVRPARSSDAELFLKWSLENTKSDFDPAAAQHASSFVMCAYDKTGPLLFVPVQQPLFLETLAIRPGLDPAEMVTAWKNLLQVVVSQCYIRGSGEIYFLGTEETTERFTEKRGFEKLPYSIYRLKLADLEKP